MKTAMASCLGGAVLAALATGHAPPAKRMTGPARAVPAAKTTVAPTPPAAVRPFPDVPPDHWAAKAVETLHARGIVVGYPGGKG